MPKRTVQYSYNDTLTPKRSNLFDGEGYNTVPRDEVYVETWLKADGERFKGYVECVLGGEVVGYGIFRVLEGGEVEVRDLGVKEGEDFKGVLEGMVRRGKREGEIEMERWNDGSFRWTSKSSNGIYCSM